MWNKNDIMFLYRLSAASSWLPNTFLYSWKAFPTSPLLLLPKEGWGHYERVIVTTGVTLPVCEVVCKHVGPVDVNGGESQQWTTAPRMWRTSRPTLFLYPHANSSDACRSVYRHLASHPLPTLTVSVVFHLHPSVVTICGSLMVVDVFGSKIRNRRGLFCWVLMSL